VNETNSKRVYKNLNFFATEWGNIGQGCVMIDNVKSMILRSDFSLASAIERDWDRCPPDD